LPLIFTWSPLLNVRFMKKVLCIIIAAAAFAVSAQAQQGTGYAGLGQISFWDNGAIEVNGTGFTVRKNTYYPPYETASITSYGISPEFGYFVTDRIAIGVSIGFNTYSSPVIERTNNNIKNLLKM